MKREKNMDFVMAVIDDMIETSEMLNIKYGATVALHYIRSERILMRHKVMIGIIDSYISNLCEQL
jgi:hypothetical protein